MRRAAPRPLKVRCPLPSSRSFSRTGISPSPLQTELTAPNGQKWEQPLGLFINNEFVKSRDGEKVTTINP